MMFGQCQKGVKAKSAELDVIVLRTLKLARDREVKELLDFTLARAWHRRQAD